MAQALSPEAVAAYRRDGFYFPHRIMTAEQALATGEAFFAFTQSDIARCYERPQDQLYLLKAHLLFTWADRICNDPGLLDAVESLIGPDIMVWSSGVFWKAPHSGAFVSWHQDSTNYELDDADKVVRAWVALTPATLASGTMRFLPGLHRRGQIRHSDSKVEGELLSRGETIDLTVDEAATVPVLIDAGEVSFHHLHAPHGSGPNASDRPRINYVITYITPEVRPLGGDDMALLVRGEDRFGHFGLEPRPKSDMDKDALVAHELAMAKRNPILFRNATLPPAPNHADKHPEAFA